MRKVMSVFCALFFFFAVAGGAFAHELILKPAQMSTAKGESLAVEVHSTHVFIVKEETEDTSSMKAAVLTNGALEPMALVPNEAELRIDAKCTVPTDGTFLILCDKLPLPWSVTNDGSKLGSRKELEAQGFKVVSATKYDKYSKAIVNAKDGDEGFAALSGQELEIVPVTNPANVKVGDFMAFKVLNKGQPVSVPVWATYDGFSPDASTYAFYTEAKSDGSFRVKITSSGLWLVRAMKTEEGKEGEYDKRTLRSIVTFEVK